MTWNTRIFFAALIVALLAPHRGAAADAPVIGIDRTVTLSRDGFVPIHLEGFTGEVAAVLKFDLEVAGCKIVKQEEAAFIVTGKNSARVEGRVLVLDRDQKYKQLFGKAFTGASPRTLAHAFADEAIKLMTGTDGITRTHIAFKVDTGNTSEIYISDYDGHNPIRVTRDGSIVAAPVWVPGQMKLLYTSYMKNFPDIFSHDLKTGKRRAVARYSGLNTSASVSPDGNQVAMILSKSGSPDVYVADLEGGNLRRLTTTRADESSPCWAPDGRSICFASRAGGRPALYSVPVGGGAMRKIRTTGASNATEPDWSPDGKTIVFTTQYRGGFTICTVPAEGGSVETLVEGEDPSWAPNSRTVVFVRRSGGRRYLSLLDVPTKHVKSIKPLAGSCSQPAWAQ